jgi:hypothetical protein
LIASAFLPSPEPCVVVLLVAFRRKNRHTQGHSTGNNNNQQQSTMCKQNQAEAHRHNRAAGCFAVDDPIAA